MSEASAPGAAAAQGSTAGAMLREARQARGLHVAALAASIKVTQRKLEALEGDRYDELPDMTFTRALAKTVCRSLKIDSAPVLALLPEVGDRGLDRVHQGLNTTYRERPGRRQAQDTSAFKRPAVWLPLLVLLAAVLLLLAPPGWLPTIGDAASTSAPTRLPASTPIGPPASAPTGLPAAASAPVASADIAASAVLAETRAAAAPAAALPAASAAASAPGLGSVLELRASGESWIEVVDASGAVLVQRTLQPGEVVGLDGTPPFRIKIGNAAATSLVYRGQPVDLGTATRDNIARLELK